jgi:hypothetical protein
VVVVGFAAVFVLQEAVAQDAPLAVPPAWELERERDVLQAAQPVAPDAQLAVPSAWELVPEQVRDVLQAAQPVALGDPLDDCLAAHC